MIHRASFMAGCALFTMAAAYAAPAMAQGEGAQASETAAEGEIIVTARRRDETAQDTPVALTVLNEALLDRYGVKGVSQIATLTPGLYTGESSGAMGGTISLRGIGSGDSMAFIDQAISSNVDGVPISSAQILRAAQLDLKQIEVLRGPQALFFGKNSPGGIISLTTAEPGNDLEAMLRVGYEFQANERYIETMVSFPISDQVGLRVAGRYGKMDGWINVVSPNVAGTIPMDINRFPKQTEGFLKGALTLKPSDRLSIRLKSMYTSTRFIGGSSNFSDIVYCPYGTPQRPSEDASNCLNDGTILLTKFSPATLALAPELENANGNRKNTQFFFSGTVDLDLTDALKLSSVTGVYNVRERLTSNGGYGPISNNGFGVRFSSDQFSQELRLASDFDGQFNFLLGGFYEHRKLYTLTAIIVPQFALNLPTESTHQKQDSYSLFGQLRFNPTEQIEITAGGRYTHETKDLLDYSVSRFVSGAFETPVDVTKQSTYPGNPAPRLSYNNFSPEVTISYKPNPDMMLFASYRSGFKSGGFDAGYTNGAILTAARQAEGQTFGPEKVRGGEVGLKSTWADRQVTFNLTGYWYEYKGLQVSVFDTTARAFRLLNAAGARVRGLEAELRYRPRAVPGLDLHASLAYNDSRYTKFLSDCYAGQTAALGCNQTLNPNQLRNSSSALMYAQTEPGGAVIPTTSATNTNAGPSFGTANAAVFAYTAQDLSGRRLRKAPVFSFNAGAYYETPVSNGIMFSLSADLSYSGGYDFGTNYQPWAYQSPYAKLDATLRLFSESKAWELAVIGRNLTNRRSLINGIDRTGTGGFKGTSQFASCGATTNSGCIAVSDLIGTPTMPRTVAIQATLRY